MVIFGKNRSTPDLDPHPPTQNLHPPPKKRAPDLPLISRNKRQKVGASEEAACGLQSCATQLKQFCVRNRINQLTLHSGRREAATQALACGVSRSKIKLCGGWSSAAVDEYFHPVRLGVDSSRRVL